MAYPRIETGRVAKDLTVFALKNGWHPSFARIEGYSYPRIETGRDPGRMNASVGRC